MSHLIQTHARHPLHRCHAVAQRPGLDRRQQLGHTAQQDQCRGGEAGDFGIGTHSAPPLHGGDQRQLGELARLNGCGARQLLPLHPLVRHQRRELSAPRRAGEAVRRAWARNAGRIPGRMTALVHPSKIINRRGQ